MPTRRRVFASALANTNRRYTVVILSQSAMGLPSVAHPQRREGGKRRAGAVREERPPALRDECRLLRGIPGGEGMPFAREDPVLEDIPPAPVPPPGFAEDALALETALL